MSTYVINIVLVNAELEEHMCGFLVYTGDASNMTEELEDAFNKLSHRGPDDHQIKNLDNGAFIAFHRLAIQGVGELGNQPFQCASTQNTLVCNGEIYNEKALKQSFTASYDFTSKSDCEVILPLYTTFDTLETAKLLDAEYAFVIYDQKKDQFVAARDPIGIRPLFYGHCKINKCIVFSSEAKALTALCDRVQIFPPGHIYNADGKFVEYKNISAIENFHHHQAEEIAVKIHDLLVEGTRKRLAADVPLGYLLSGGLDSSLIVSIAAKLSDKPLDTFAIGMDYNPIDLKYAKEVADHLGTNHHEVIMTKADVLAALKDVIYFSETWDITTIRASIGMYLVCKYIKQHTDIKVLMTGEISDEIFGYKYTDFAPNPLEFQKEAQKRLKELHMYDVLRADRCISAHSLEARVPFGDLDFVDYVMRIHPAQKVNSYGIGKYLLRNAFAGSDYLPQSILYREKAAFSDAVGHSMVDELKNFAAKKYSGADLEGARFKYTHGTPQTKESLLYREIFEELFPDQAHLIAAFWMPNKDWENCDVDDPSARALPNYGKSAV